MKASTKSQKSGFSPPCRRARGAFYGPPRMTRRGATLVEFALVVPLLLLLMMGMIQFGIIINARLSLSNTMRQVARYGAVNASKPDADALITNYAISTARGYGLTLKNDDVAIGPPNQNSADNPNNRQRYVTQLPIALSYDLSPHIFMPVGFPGADFVFKRQARYEVKVMVE